MEACLQNTGDLKTGLLKWIGHAREESKKGNTEKNIHAAPVNTG
jgi:hypothetical protein